MAIVAFPQSRCPSRPHTFNTFERAAFHYKTHRYSYANMIDATPLDIDIVAGRWRHPLNHRTHPPHHTQQASQVRDLHFS